MANRDLQIAHVLVHFEYDTAETAVAVVQLHLWLWWWLVQNKPLIQREQVLLGGVTALQNFSSISCFSQPLLELCNSQFAVVSYWFLCNLS